MKIRKPKLVQGGVSTQRLHERVLELEARIAVLGETNDILMGAIEELTLQTQFLLRSITDKQEVTGLLDLKPRTVVVRLLDIYRKKKSAIIQELEHERKAIAEAHRRDEERLLAALKDAGIDPNDAAKVDAYLASLDAAAAQGAASQSPVESDPGRAG